MTKVNSILFIDDDEATNFIHKIVVNKLQVTDRVITMEKPEEALKFLTTQENGEYPQPDLIFLDINMPGMDGWEFLEEYKKTRPDTDRDQILIMLTTSLNPDDEEKAKHIPEISGFRNKPLTNRMLKEILNEFFPSFKYKTFSQ